MARRLIALATMVTVVTAMAALTAGGSVAAGGWAITVVDPFSAPRAGDVLDVSFTILQHGRTPVDVDDVMLIVRQPDGSNRRSPAEPAGEVGRYRAAITVAEAGRYTWTIQQGIFGPQDLGGFDVAAAPESSFLGTSAIAAAVGVAGLAGLAVLGVRRRRAASTDQPLSVSSNPQFSEM
ncbi:hypothetical protein BH18ACT2_BH18ACT2_18540 [soil metagenome]